MVFEARIRFVGDEGDEVAVMEVMDEAVKVILLHTNVEVKSAQLFVQDQIRDCQRRDHAASNKSR